MQFFLNDLIKRSEQIAIEYGISKLSPAVLKHALAGMDNYEFMKDALDDV